MQFILSNEWYFNWEFSLLDWISEHRIEWLNSVMKFISFLGNKGWLWIVIALVLLAWPKYRKTGLKMALSLIIMTVVGNMILKPWVARVRPYEINTAMELLVAKLSSYSFPSGHTYGSFAGAVVLLLNHKKIGIPAVILAALIGFSRMYLYVHFPTDVLAGMVLGIVTAIAANWIINRIYEKRGMKTC